MINEWLAGKLAEELNLPVPKFESIEIIRGSYDAAVVTGNVLPSGIGFGSRNVDGAVELSEDTINFNSQRFFKQLENPEDIIRIGVFDVWLANDDRNGNNYNLLLQRREKHLSVIAIDHTFLFEDMRYENLEAAKDSFADKNGSLFGTQLFQGISSRITRKSVLSATDSLLEELAQLTDTDFNVMLDTVPAEWSLTGQERSSIRDFLLYRQQPLQEAIHTLLKP